MSVRTRDFVQELFLKYYTECFDQVEIPSSFERREFAALLFKEKIMVRHRAFKTSNELQDFLCSVIPSDVYYSSAHYEQPDAAEMSAKGWIGADLVFDIDADHIFTPCDRTHDEWTCGKCGFSGKGITPEKCPACNGEKFSDSTWLCEVCLDSAKTETVKLLDMLMRDFGLSEKEVHVFFSGHRGYHVHAVDEAIEGLDATARKEIADYVRGLGFDSALHGLSGDNLKTLCLKDAGWRGRIAKGIYDFIHNANPEDFKSIGIDRVLTATSKNKDTILKSLSESRPLGKIKGIGPSTWHKIIECAAKSQSAEVDTVVTTDVHRLIRLPGTLHGKTGLKKVGFQVSTIDDFDPFKNAIAFKGGEATVLVSSAPKFRIGDETYGPYKDQRITLPTAAALLLVCKKRAEVVL